MFSYVWKTGIVIDFPKYKSKYTVTHYLPLMWIEHCVECSAPLCYSTCKMYKPRADKRCLRFEHGVLPVRFGRDIWGGQITFRRWAKLQSPLPIQHNGIEISNNNRISNIVKNTGLCCERLMKGIPWGNHRPAKVIESLGLTYLTKHEFKKKISPIDGFLSTVYNHEKNNITLLLEVVDKYRTLYKTSFILKPGWNEYFIPYYNIKLTGDGKKVARIYLDNDAVGTLTFMHLDFVTISQTDVDNLPSPAKKVKCVAWDLDNTLWKGVIGDTVEGIVEPNKQALSLIKQLDKMGVLQTIVSKNTYDIAWNKIVELGIHDYFLYPAINWGRKSQNMLAIAKEMNINIDTFALIDDSVFEREEVCHTLPQVRAYDVTDIENLLKYPEFDIPVTEESGKRRLSYQTESKRKLIQTSYGDDYDKFLKECCMELTIFKPSVDSEKKRCLELLQRSNQYNVSIMKRTEDDYTALYTNNEYRIYAMHVSDKFGSYGIVGFVSIHVMSNEYELTDFVMSCRVAQKKVERAFFNWLVSTLDTGKTLIVNVHKTDRNVPLREELQKMPFVIVHDTEDSILFTYKCEEKPFLNDNIINVTYRK